jgi:hypothetical protein
MAFCGRLPPYRGLKAQTPNLLKKHTTARRNPAILQRLFGVRAMTMKFPGSFEDLKKCAERTRIDGEWQRIKNYRRYRTTTGGVLNWWKSTGTIQFQGPPAARRELERAVLRRMSKMGKRIRLGRTVKPEAIFVVFKMRVADDDDE